MNTAPAKWPCVDAGCGTNLGNITNGELVIEMSNIGNVNTDGVNIVLVCRQCGKPKKWFSKPSAIQDAFVDLIISKIARAMNGR